MVEFWDLRRLTEHLRKSPTCLAAYAASDIDADEPAATASGYAWVPATTTFGPTPWWATLDPELPPA